jgi:hypothetical protein
MLVVIELISLPPIENDQYETWHTMLLRQIRTYNVHTLKVFKRRNAENWIEAKKAKTEGEASQENF